MNKTQLKRWKKVSVGLAQNAYPKITTARREKLIKEINCFINDLARYYDLAEIRDWEANGGGCYVCDELSDFLWDRRYSFERITKGWFSVEDGKFGNTLSCCIRAGFDMAVSRSCGVVGYTVGELRAIFAGKLPKWIQEKFDTPERLAVAGNHEGVWL